MTNPHSVLLILIKLPESFRRRISREKEARSIANGPMEESSSSRKEIIYGCPAELKTEPEKAQSPSYWVTSMSQ
ncbi:hypothetical protein NC652_021029 [Populus alba x Populus x berolinensis]|nr:hypothetical protein NC652_021029 [Populus alba x Populus x berolinensis]